MWIKKDVEEMVQLDYTQSIVMFIDNKTKKFKIIFYQRRNIVKFSFNTEIEVREYYENLQDTIAAQEIKPKFKL